MSERAITTETDRLAKLVRLIFSSDKEGEIVGAVMAARRVLETNGLDCHWLADQITAPVAHADDRDDHSDIWFAFHRRYRLSPKERLFVENIASRSGPLSARQRQWLSDICDRLAPS
jgi:hypothetical protein